MARLILNGFLLGFITAFSGLCALESDKFQTDLAHLEKYLNPPEMATKKQKSTVKPFAESFDFKKELNFQSEPHQYKKRLQRLRLFDGSDRLQTVLSQAQLISIIAATHSFRFINHDGKMLKVDTFCPENLSDEDLKALVHQKNGLQNGFTMAEVVSDSLTITKEILNTVNGKVLYAQVHSFLKDVARSIDSKKMKSCATHTHKKCCIAHARNIDKMKVMLTDLDHDSIVAHEIKSPEAFSFGIQLSQYLKRPSSGCYIPAKRAFNPEFFLKILQQNAENTEIITLTKYAINSIVVNLMKDSYKSKLTKTRDLALFTSEELFNNKNKLKHILCNMPWYQDITQAHAKVLTMMDDMLKDNFTPDQAPLEFLQTTVAGLRHKYQALRTQYDLFTHRIDEELAHLAKSHKHENIAPTIKTKNIQDSDLANDSEKEETLLSEKPNDEPLSTREITQYHSRIMRWFNDSDFLREQNDSSVRYHTWDLAIDPIIMRHGLRHKRNGHFDKPDEHYCMAGQIEYQELEKTIKKFVVFTLCINPEGMCYHRGYETNCYNELYQKLKKPSYEYEYPSLQEIASIDERFKPIVTGNAHITNDNAFFIQIIDTNLNMKITLYKIDEI